MSKKAKEVNPEFEVNFEANGVVEETAVQPYNEGGLVSLDGYSQPSLTALFENPQSVFYSSIKNDGTRESQIRLYNALNGSDIKRVKEQLAPFEVTDLVAHYVEMTNDETGEIEQVTRVVLISPNGERYHSVAKGVVNSMQQIVAIVGQAPWSPPIKLVQQRVTTRKGRETITLGLVAE